MDEERKDEEKGAAPEWAKSLISAVENLSDRLTEALQEEPEQPEPEPVQKVPVPPVQEPEPEQQEPQILQVQDEQPQPKKKKFLDWLL